MKLTRILQGRLGQATNTACFFTSVTSEPTETETQPRGRPARGNNRQRKGRKKEDNAINIVHMMSFYNTFWKVTTMKDLLEHIIQNQQSKLIKASSAASMKKLLDVMGALQKLINESEVCVACNGELSNHGCLRKFSRGIQRDRIEFVEMKTGLCDSCLNKLKAPHSRFNDIHNWSEKGYEGIEYEAIRSAKKRVEKYPDDPELVYSDLNGAPRSLQEYLEEVGSEYLQENLEEHGGENNEDDNRNHDNDNHDGDNHDDDDDDEADGQIQVNNEHGGDFSEPDNESGSASTSENEFNSSPVPQRIAAPQRNAHTIGKQNQPHWRLPTEHSNDSESDDTGGTKKLEDLAQKHRDDSNVDDDMSVSSGGSGGTAAMMEKNDLYESGEYESNADYDQYLDAMMLDGDNFFSCDFPNCQITDSELHDCENCPNSKFHIECLREYLGDKTTDGTNSEVMAKYCMFCLCCEANECANGHGVFLHSDKENGVSCCAECSRRGHSESCIVQRDNNTMVCHTCHIKSLQNFMD